MWAGLLREDRWTRSLAVLGRRWESGCKDMGVAEGPGGEHSQRCSEVGRGTQPSHHPPRAAVLERFPSVATCGSRVLWGLGADPRAKPAPEAGALLTHQDVRTEFFHTPRVSRAGVGWPRLVFISPSPPEACLLLLTAASYIALSCWQKGGLPWLLGLWAPQCDAHGSRPW